MERSKSTPQKPASLQNAEKSEAHFELEATVYETVAVLDLIGIRLAEELAMRGKEMDCVATGVSNLIRSTQQKLNESFEKSFAEWVKAKALIR